MIFLHACSSTMALEMAPKIFIVDDDAAVRSGISLLVRSCGWEPMACASATELFETIGEGSPACLLLDLQMPGMDGVSVQRELVRQGFDVPVIYTTTLSDHPLVEQAITNGARQVISKPFRPDALIDAIAKVIDPP